MKSIIRVVSISHKLSLGDPQQTVKEMLSLLEEAKQHQPDICLFPACSFTGSQLGTLHYHETVLTACKACLQELLTYSQNTSSYLIFGSMILQDGNLTPVTYVVHNGEAKTVFSDGNNNVFTAEGTTFRIINDSLDDLSHYFTDVYTKADIALVLSHTPAKAGNAQKAEQLLKTLSEDYSAGIVLANGCVGDTSFPYLSRGISASFACGKALAFEADLMHSVYTVSDLDCDMIRAEQNKKAKEAKVPSEKPLENLPENVVPDPYLPADLEEKKAYLLDLFELQAASLAIRLANIHCSKMVIGISGGLDSTLALLVSYKACDLLGLSKDNIIAVTMQGFGTSGSTYQNALTLMKNLGCTLLEVPIRDAVLQHFKDIGHDPNVFDVTYENAQARERTQILLDIANQNGAIVVGTGDLSEEALGFATFAGDHISNFNVNTCVTKTMIRQLVGVLSETDYFAVCSDVLKAILATPISPELLPVDAQGNIAQKTEEILGPYELHDFFLYYLIKYRFGPAKIYGYAKKAFGDRFEDEYIKDKLKIFFRRFCTSQFKRSCTPDSAVLTEINLSNSEFSMPSDLSAKLFLDEIETL